MGCRVDVDERADNLELVDATKKNNYKKCKTILEGGKTNVNTREPTTNQTALHYAATSSKCKILELILTHNADCNIQDREGNTPLLLVIKKCKQKYERKQKHKQNTLLHLAENNNDFQDTVDKLLDHNADCNVSDNSGNTPLHLAACNGFQTIVDKLLKKQADCMAYNSNEDTPLHLAAAEGHHNCCEKLLQKDDGIDVKNKDKNTPLHLAAKKGHLEVVELLKGRRANCSEQNSLGETPLHLAATEGHLDCFQVIQNDQNINLRKNGGFTPLHCAANKGNAEIVDQLLLVSGVDCKAQDKDGNTPLHLAVTMGHRSCCDKLLECRNVDVNSQNEKKEASLHLAASQGRRDVCALLLKHQNIDINIKNKSKKTPLHLAAKHSNDDVVELLLSHKKPRANGKLLDKHGYMPLHYAAENGSEKSCQHLVKKVINEYTDKKPIKLAIRNRQTPLMLAAKKGHYRCCETLLFKDIDFKDKEGNTCIPHFKDINAKDQYGNTALLYAAEGGFMKTISSLIKNGASTNVVNNDENTVLHQAAKAKADDCLQYLLESPGDMDLNAKEAKNGFTPLHEAINSEALACAKILLDHKASALEKCKKYGRTPLHLAAKQGDPGLCSLLSKDKEMVNMEDKNNQTPLHVAAEHGCRDVCKVLLATKGIQVLAKDKNRRTALHLAAQKGHDRVLKLLTKKGVSPSATDEEGSTALHLAAKNGHLKCCEILLSTSRHLIDKVDDKEKFPVDVAFEERQDEVFAYLMKTFKPPREDTTKQSLKQWSSQLHKYMHQSLQEGEPRVVAAEAIIESDWWEAAFFTQDKGSTGQSHQHYCANFQELIISHPNLALKAQNRCITDDGISRDFRLFKDNTCHEEDDKKPAQGPALTSTQRFLQEHPLSLMVQHTRKELLQHPLIKAWLTHLWKTFLFYIFIFLLIIEILFLASLNAFMASTDNWARVEYKCNSTREQLCGFKIHLSSNVPEGSLNKTTAEETSRMLPNDELGDFSQCQNILSSNFGMWIFLLVMTVIIVALEGKYWCRLRQQYFKPKRSLRFFQVFFTVILLLPIGTCNFQPQMWIWTTWQWHCGIIGLLLEWLRFINMLNQLPLLFVFMPITKHFFWNYMKALGYILLLLFAFSHIFHLLLANQAAFESWSQSMMKMIVWLLGDLNYDDTFVDGNLIYPDVGKLVFVVFIIVVGGYIANLAITQPSERVDEFRKGAAYFQMESQSTLFLETRACFPELWEVNEKWFGSKKTCLNILSSRLAEKIMNMNITSEKNLPEENPLQDLKQQVDTLMNLCTEQTEEIKDLKDKLDILLRRIPEPLPHIKGENTRDS